MSYSSDIIRENKHHFQILIVNGNIIDTYIRYHLTYQMFSELGTHQNVPQNDTKNVTHQSLLVKKNYKVTDLK